jgi:hypothetical protein
MAQQRQQDKKYAKPGSDAYRIWYLQQRRRQRKAAQEETP